jgi:hypothetical protein
MKKIALPKMLALALALGVAAWTSLPATADAPLVTVTGTVVSLNDEVLVVSTDKGNLTFDLDKSTEMTGVSLAVGNRITVWYDSDDKVEDAMDARKIVMAPAATSTPAPASPTPAPQVTTQETSSAYQADANDELPATAGPLPLMTLVGLISLAGGLLLRKRTRR